MARTRILYLTLTITFFALTLCGAGFFASHAEASMHVPGCPFAHPTDIACQSSAMSQLSRFAAVLGALPGQTLTLLAALLACLAIGSVVVCEPPQSRISVRSILKQNFEIQRPLQLAFADGTLNPKLF